MVVLIEESTVAGILRCALPSRSAKLINTSNCSLENHILIKIAVINQELIEKRKLLCILLMDNNINK